MPGLIQKGELEYRINPKATLRVVGADGRRIRGLGVVFNSLSEDLGFFKEQIAPEAVDRTIRENLDVRGLINHDPSLILGRTKSGTMKLEKTREGLAYYIDPPDTSAANDILKSIARGDVSGSSFAFQTIEDSWDLQTDPPTRRVLDMRMYDVSVVTYPAYPATDVAVRSLQQAREAMRKPDPLKIQEFRNRLAMLIDPTPGIELRGAIPPHSTATSASAWDGPAAKANLHNDAGAATFRLAFAWVDAEGDPDVKSSYKFIHHFVSSGGQVGAASLRACSAGIAVLNGGRTGTTIPDADRQGVWNHLARHLRDAGQEPPPLQ